MTKHAQLADIAEQEVRNLLEGLAEGAGSDAKTRAALYAGAHRAVIDFLDAAISERQDRPAGVTLQ